MGREKRETKQDIQWLGVQDSLMDVNNPPNGRNTVISFGMKGMSWEVVKVAEECQRLGKLVKLEVFSSKCDTGYCK